MLLDRRIMMMVLIGVLDEWREGERRAGVYIRMSFVWKEEGKTKGGME